MESGASSNAIVVLPDNNGKYVLKNVRHADLKQIDISDIDLVLTIKDGSRYLLPGGGLAAMDDHPPQVVFADDVTTVGKLLGLAEATDKPETVLFLHEDVGGNKSTTSTTEATTSEKSADSQSHAQQQSSVSSLTVNTESSVEEMVEKVQKAVESLHNRDYDYVPSQSFHPPPAAPAPPPGVPPPLSLTPIITLFMGNITGVTSDTTSNPGYTTFFGSGGLDGTGAVTQLGPRDALQFTPSIIDTTSVSGNVIVYAEGPKLGNTNPSVSNSTNYAKEFLLNVAGYFVSLDDVKISGVPAGVIISGATDQGNGNWVLPYQFAIPGSNKSFTITYDTTTVNSGDTFDIKFEVTGKTTRAEKFDAVQTVRFEYLNVTDATQVTDPTLIWGYGKLIYVLPILDQPNIITAGNGDNKIYGSRSSDTITTGDGNNLISSSIGSDNITAGNGNNTISAGNGLQDIVHVGNGNNAITLGNGNKDTIVAGSGNNTIVVGSGTGISITAGSGTNTITTGNGSGTIISGAGGNKTNTVNINNDAASTSLYSVTLGGSGNNTVTHTTGQGDGNYTIAMGNTTGTNTVNIGDSTATATGSLYDTTITLGSGTSSVTAGAGQHSISVGAGATAITVGGNSRNLITTAGGGGTITSNGNGNNTVYVNSPASSTALYTISLAGTGSNTVSHTSAAADGNFNITMGNTAGTHTVNVGNSTATGDGSTTFDSTITLGSGTNTVTTGAGVHKIAVGTGAATITVAGDNNNQITAAGGGGTISVAGNGNNSITTTGTGNYAVTVGTGTDVLSLGAGSHTIIAGNGTNTITTGAGFETITGGSGANTVTTGGGGGVINIGAGGSAANAIFIDNALTGTTTDAYTLTLSGTGSNTVSTHAHNDGNYTIAMGNTTGTNTVNIGDSTATATGSLYDTTITLGSGTSSVTAGAGQHSISVGAGATAITVGGNSRNLITTAGGGGTITSNGNGNNTVYVNSPASSTALYTISLAGTGSNTVSHTSAAADGNFNITMGNTAGAHTVNVGNSTATGDGSTTFDSTITLGSGTNTVTTGAGVHKIAVGTGVATINTSSGNNKLILAGGGGSITTAQGNNIINITTTSGATDAYTLNGSGTGNTTLTAGDGYYNITAATGINALTIGNGNSTINALGIGKTNVIAGNGAMTINLGDGANNSISTQTGLVNLTVGNGNNSTVTTVGGGGTVTVGNGNGDIVNVGSGNYTITVGNGLGDQITAGGGNNTITIGTGGNDTVTVGVGNNTVNVGLGTGNVFNGGAGSNTLKYTAVINTLTFTLGATTGSGTVAGSGVGGTFTNFATIYGGSGNNTFIGSDMTTLINETLYGGTANNTFTHPNAGTAYIGNNNQPFTAGNSTIYTATNTTATNPFAGATNIPSYVQYTYNGVAATINLNIGYLQVNTVDYSTASVTSTVTVDLTNLTTTGNSAQGSTYAYINKIIANGGNGSGFFFKATPAYNAAFIGNTSLNIFDDRSTLSSQVMLLVGNSTASGAVNTPQYQPGAAKEIFVLNSVNQNNVYYNNSPAGVVLNLDSVAHTFGGGTSTLYPSLLTLNAYSGSNWGSNINTGVSIASGNLLSWSNGDFFVPVKGTAVAGTGNIYMEVSNSYDNVVFANNSNFMYFRAGNRHNYFYGGNSGSAYYMNGPTANNTTANVNATSVAVAGTGGTQLFYVNTGYSMHVVLDPKLENYGTRTTQYNFDKNVPLTYDGTTYTGFAYGWWGTSTPYYTTNTGGSPITYIKGYRMILGAGGNDIFVGDNGNDQFSASSGSNVIILGSGTNIINAHTGINTIESSGATGQTVGINTLNFSTAGDARNGNIYNWNAGTTTYAYVFLNNSTKTFYLDASNGDQYGITGGYSTIIQANTGNGYANVVGNIITTLNGSSYSHLAAGVNNSTTNVFQYDNTYSGAPDIWGYQTSTNSYNVYFDNMTGTTTQTIHESSGSNLIYATAAQIPYLTVTGTSPTTTVATQITTGNIDILRIEGWGNTSASGNAFTAGTGSLTDPFATAKITGINIVDVRSGTDNLTAVNTSINIGANSTTHNGPVFNLNVADVQNLNGHGTTSSIYLMLDNGEKFVPTAGTHYAVVGDTAGGTSGNLVFYLGTTGNYANAPTLVAGAPPSGFTAIVDVHFGPGAFSSTYAWNSWYSTYHASA